MLNMLPMRADRTGEVVVRLVLPTALELVNPTGLSLQQVKDDVLDLEAMGLVERYPLGCLRPGALRMRPTDIALDKYGASEVQRTWLRPAGLGNLVRFDLLKLESVNDITRLYGTDGWSLRGTQFYEWQPVTATAEHHKLGEPPAYTVFFCVARMDTERAICNRLEAVPHFLDSIAEAGVDAFHPSRLCIVAPNEWFATRALRLAMAIFPDWLAHTDITAWYYEKGRWFFADGYLAFTAKIPAFRALQPSTGRLIPQPSTRRLRTRRSEFLRPPSWDEFRQIVDRSPWSGRSGLKLLQSLTQVGDRPVAALDLQKVWAGESQESTRTERRIRELKSMGYVDVVRKRASASTGKLIKERPRGELDEKPKKWHLSDWSPAVPKAISPRGQNVSRLALTKSGMREYCLVNGGTPERLAARTKLGGVETGEWNVLHDDLCYEMHAQFIEMGCLVVPAWQAWVTMADGSRIEPDGVVQVDTDIWGTSWCYLEGEVSDRAFTEAEPRCGRYASPHRLDEYPLLIALYNETAERNWHAAGAQHNLRMLTTIMRRLAESGVGGEGVWSHYGVPVTLRA